MYVDIYSLYILDNISPRLMTDKGHFVRSLLSILDDFYFYCISKWHNGTHFINDYLTESQHLVAFGFEFLVYFCVYLLCNSFELL